MSEFSKNKDGFEDLMRNSMRQNFKERLESERKAYEENHKNTRIKLLLGTLPYAAVLLVMAGAISLWGTQKPVVETAYTYLLETEVNYKSELIRGESSKTTIRITDIEESADILSRYSDKIEQLTNSEKLVIAALLLRDKDRLFEAGRVLDGIQGESSDLRMEKLWLQGLCHVMRQENEKAVEYLEELESVFKYKVREREKLLTLLKNTKK